MAEKKSKKKQEVDPRSCSNCEFFFALDHSDAGQCYRVPPIPILDEEGNGIQSLRPIVFIDERACGEFKQKLDS